MYMYILYYYIDYRHKRTVIIITIITSGIRHVRGCTCIVK